VGIVDISPHPPLGVRLGVKRLDGTIAYDLHRYLLGRLEHGPQKGGHRQRAPRAAAAVGDKSCRHRASSTVRVVTAAIARTCPSANRACTRWSPRSPLP